MIHTVKGFGIVNKAEIDVFLEPSLPAYQTMTHWPCKATWSSLGGVGYVLFVCLFQTSVPPTKEQMLIVREEDRSRAYEKRNRLWSVATKLEGNTAPCPHPNMNDSTIVMFSSLESHHLWISWHSEVGRQLYQQTHLGRSLCDMAWPIASGTPREQSNDMD